LVLNSRYPSHFTATTTLFAQIVVGLELSYAKLEMVGAEINESGALRIGRYVL